MRILELCSVLAPRSVSSELLGAAFEGNAPDELHRARCILLSQSIVTASPDGIVVNSLVQRVVREGCDEQKQHELVACAVNVLAALLEKSNHKRLSEKMRSTLLPHAVHALKSCLEIGSAPRSSGAVTESDMLAIYLARGKAHDRYTEYAEAVHYFQLALSCATDAETKAISWVNLAVSYDHLGGPENLDKGLSVLSPLANCGTIPTDPAILLQYWWAVYMYGVILAHSGREVEAETRLRLVYENANDHQKVAALHQIGVLKFEARDHSGALELYALNLELHAGNCEIDTARRTRWRTKNWRLQVSSWRAQPGDCGISKSLVDRPRYRKLEVCI